MILKSFPCGPIETNALLLACDSSKEAAIIDAPQGCLGVLEKVIQELGLHVKMILLTHSHWDHIAGLEELKKRFNAPVYVHMDDAANVETPGADALPLYFPIGGVIPDVYLNEGPSLSLGSLKIQVIHTPGHTPGCVCFYIEKEHVLVSGDTLFRGSMGRLDLPTGQPEKMGDSLRKLSRLPADTQVYPGHGPTTTIGRESWLTHPEERINF